MLKEILLLFILGLSFQTVLSEVVTVSYGSKIGQGTDGPAATGLNILDTESANLFNNTNLFSSASNVYYDLGIGLLYALDVNNGFTSRVFDISSWESNITSSWPDFNPAYIELDEEATAFFRESIDMEFFKSNGTYYVVRTLNGEPPLIELWSLANWTMPSLVSSHTLNFTTYHMAKSTGCVVIDHNTLGNEDGPGFLVYEISPNLTSLDLIGSYNPTIGNFNKTLLQITDLLISNEYLYTAMGTGGLTIWNFSDPNNVTEIQNIDVFDQVDDYSGGITDFCYGHTSYFNPQPIGILANINGTRSVHMVAFSNNVLSLQLVEGDPSLYIWECTTFNGVDMRFFVSGIGGVSQYLVNTTGPNTTFERLSDYSSQCPKLEMLGQITPNSVALFHTSRSECLCPNPGTGPCNLEIRVESPSSLQTTYPYIPISAEAIYAVKLAVLDNVLNAEIALAQDLNDTDNNDGCGPIQNITGKVCLVFRNVCTFDVKMQNCKDAGGIATFIVNREGGTPVDIVSAVWDQPVLLLDYEHGNALRQAILLPPGPESTSPEPEGTVPTTPTPVTPTPPTPVTPTPPTTPTTPTTPVPTTPVPTTPVPTTPVTGSPVAPLTNNSNSQSLYSILSLILLTLSMIF